MKNSVLEELLPEVEQEVAVKEQVSKEHKIVLFNDEVNTFDHVIDMLVATCDHTPIQAEQCSLIVHYKGKCDVKTGDYDDLKPRCSALLEGGLTAEIQ
ncbi:Clp protease ClpS [Nonlabens spongiae]|uniref:Clp protease ClpS n=1 Tax=Nonlabens spongiae TaxID=331648 RepID=A0A1W6MHE9_9FLAO|nr:ATP-dependent Clp protease adaptor ClpS [Nonlabens spongiae]ARN77012.1 Clp protease ClpS [Nonlabens spongiae]